MYYMRDAYNYTPEKKVQMINYTEKAGIVVIAGCYIAINIGDSIMMHYNRDIQVHNLKN